MPIRLTQIIAIFAIIAIIFALGAAPALAADGDSDSGGFTVGKKSIAAGLTIGLASGAAGIGMGLMTGKACRSIAMQPEQSDKIRTSFMLGLVFVETAIIYALLVVVLIIFVL